MKEDEFLFPEDNEGGVPELEQLGQGEQPGPEGGDLGIEGKGKEDNEDDNEDNNEDGNIRMAPLYWSPRNLGHRRIPSGLCLIRYEPAQAPSCMQEENLFSDL